MLRGDEVWFVDGDARPEWITLLLRFRSGVSAAVAGLRRAGGKLLAASAAEVGPCSPVVSTTSGDSIADAETMLAKLDELGKVDQLDEPGRRAADGTLPEATKAAHASFASGAAASRLLRSRLGEATRGRCSSPLCPDSLTAESLDRLRRRCRAGGDGDARRVGLALCRVEEAAEPG